MLEKILVKKNNFIVITGGPGTGKSSLIRMLEGKGQVVVHEQSRIFIQEALASQSGITPWQDLKAFSDLVFNARKADFLSQNSSQYVYFDRALPDALAYMLLDGLTIPKTYWADCKNYRYHSNVFISPPWEKIYIQDRERQEDFQKAVEIDKALRKTYALLGYTVVDLPLVSIENRLEYIFHHLQWAQKKF